MSRITEIQHPSHRHRLTLFTSIQTSFQCDGCKERGLESCYKCNEGNCNFHLHGDCAFASGFGPIFHPFFKNCIFTFHGEYQADNRNCVACGKEVGGFMYESSSNEALVLHPCCLKLPHSKTTSDHGVKVTLRKQVSLMRKCQICNRRKLRENIKGWAYVSDCGKHRYHVACVKDMIFNNLHNVQVLAPTEGSNTSTLSLQVQRSVFNVKNFRKYGGRIIKLIVEVIISAIFGDAISIILTLVDVIQQN
nr:uncharacterized protein LOC112013858 [Quercus suber]XP_023904761.1 uncharacterized protein LOC112016429 [Quercus suber]POE45064.1 hypothetical protein CFP56_24996 [Quercus suber]POE48585.1 hypothetical protein CFP56_77679 [Quercus suber]